ncbi:MAG TPA: efflux RND transporter periplasmic adaptor subunit [Humisphaera sp.]|jgi:RND family efflux transporter MFP subunit|nr:efflux RND transporter periplasmic adaptor subunit [Humisphaera sp.]
MSTTSKVIALLIAIGSVPVVLIAAHAMKPKEPMQSHAKQLWHCGMHPQVIREAPGDCPICHMALTPMNANGADVHRDQTGPAVVQIDPAVVQNMGVRTTTVTRGPLAKTVRTIGILSLPETGLHDVSLKVGGWINHLYADQEGMHVHQGDPLFAIYSPELQTAAQELISAEKALRSLGDRSSDATRHESQILVESAKRKLQLWDVDPRDIDAIAAADQPPPQIIFRSPATGHIEEKMIVQGASIQPGMKLLRIADHSTMWLEAQIYEDQFPFIKSGQKIIATVEASPGKQFIGEINFIYPHVDHMARTLKVRAALNNPDFELKPGMYATAMIQTEPIADAILCPREAVIDFGQKQIVFIDEGGGHFSPHQVRAGLLGDDDKLQILEGLEPGQTVVTSGQFLMDVESRTIEATQKLGSK